MAQRVRLPNGQSFLTSYKRVSRRNFPRNVTVKWTRQVGPRNKRRRKTQKDGNLLGTLEKLGTKALTSTVLLKKKLGVAVKFRYRKKSLVDKGIKHAPELYRLGTSKIKIKNIKRALESEVANYVVQEALKKSSRKCREIIRLKNEQRNQ